ncbi:MAG TPA: hypothetical protein VK152_11665 [Paludibacter sp.]|nr:hypothetical protein [Paludibacter sp.]
MAKNNKGLQKLKAIDALAKKIREAGGSKTVTVKVVKYNIKQKDAVKQAARELRGSTAVKAHKRIRRKK